MLGHLGTDDHTSMNDSRASIQTSCVDALLFLHELEGSEADLGLHKEQKWLGSSHKFRQGIFLVLAIGKVTSGENTTEREVIQKVACYLPAKES